MRIALLEYFVTEKKTYVFLVKKNLDTPLVAELAIGKEELKIQHRAFLQAVMKTPPPSLCSCWGAMLDEMLAPFYALGDALIGCHARALEGTDLLYIVPHKELHYFPFHAMKLDLDGTPRYVIEHFEVVYLPAASLLKHCQDANPLRKGKSTIESALLMAAWKADEAHPNHFTAETEHIAHTLGTEALNGVCASKQAFFQRVQNSDLIHLSCHGYFFTSEDTMRTSGILLSDGFSLPPHLSGEETCAMDSFFLSAAELLHIRLACTLMTLSSCETGMSETLSGDELLGLSRALIYAGTPTLLMARWMVRGRACAEFMRYFYDTWLGAPERGKSHAFRQASLALLSSKHADYRRVSDWGAYYLIGDWK